MDQITTDVRMAEWISVIQQCQNRPDGQTAKQWLEENGVSSKKYYYWLRKVRKQFYNDTVESLPDRHSVATTGLAYVELPTDEHVSNAATITLRTRKATLEIAGASDELAVRLVEAVSHAI